MYDLGLNLFTLLNDLFHFISTVDTQATGVERRLHYPHVSKAIYGSILILELAKFLVDDDGLDLFVKSEFLQGHTFFTQLKTKIYHHLYVFICEFSVLTFRSINFMLPQQSLFSILNGHPENIIAKHIPIAASHLIDSRALELELVLKDLVQFKLLLSPIVCEIDSYIRR